MKVYLALEALPWESFNIEVEAEDGQKGKVSAKSNATLAGYLPLFWSESAAKAALPHSRVQEIEVEDNWHPMLNAMREASEAAAPVEEISADAS